MATENHKGLGYQILGRQLMRAVWAVHVPRTTFLFRPLFSPCGSRLLSGSRISMQSVRPAAKALYPNLFRTAAPDRAQARALAALWGQLGWDLACARTQGGVDSKVSCDSRECASLRELASTCELSGKVPAGPSEHLPEVIRGHFFVYQFTIG